CSRTPGLFRWTAAMFVRFAVSERHPDSYWWKGAFKAIGELEDSGRLTAWEQEHVEEELDWFRDFLPIPTCFRQRGSRRGICWFTPQAGAMVTRMWWLVRVLENHGKRVRLFKTSDPGMRLYRDEFQVVAVPQSRQRVRVTRLKGWFWM